jgi:argininosuccinate lyase
MGSIAHSRGLVRSGLLPQAEQRQLEEVLQKIAKQADTPEGFPIQISDEDCHTAIENTLIAELGQVGKKIHLGRSRNDQILTVVRLYGKDILLELRSALLQIIQRLVDFAAEHEFVPMPGRTHMQIAMPSTLGLWADSFAQQLADDYQLLATAWELTNQSPLGAAASYGVPLPLDREFTAGEMGFSRVQRNVLGVNNSRGKIEAITLDACDQVALTLSKLAQDLILFSLPEFGYFSLPDELTSGSSIMPQKKNPDGLELMRARAASISGWAIQIKNIIRSLPSGYNRDFQDTKEPFLRGTRSALECIRIMDLTVEKLVIHPEKLVAGFSDEIYATDDAISLVEQGMSFRDAYQEVGKNMNKVQSRDPKALIDRRTSTGYAGNLGLEIIRSQVQELGQQLKGDQDSHFRAVENCLGEGLRLS